MSVVVSSPFRPVRRTRIHPPSSRVVRTSHTHHINQSHTDPAGRRDPRSRWPPRDDPSVHDSSPRPTRSSTAGLHHIKPTSDDPTTSPFHE